MLALVTKRLGLLVVLFCAALFFFGFARVVKKDPAGDRFTDIDHDGLLEYQLFPYDCDHDGSGWVQCSGAQVEDRACAYAGERVWPDFNNDFACAVDHLAPGGTIELEDGIYPIRVHTCSGGVDDGKSCNLSNDSECAGVGTCEDATWYSAYNESVTYPNGELRASAATVDTVLPSLRKTGMTLTAVSSADKDGYRDGVRSGAWIVQDLGSTWSGAGSILGSIGIWGFGTGVDALGSRTAYGTTQVAAAPCNSTANIIGWSPNAGTKRLCIENSGSWVDNCATDGMPILVAGELLNHHGNAYQYATISQVCDTGDAACSCGTGKYIGIDGLHGAVGDAATPFGSVTALDERYRTEDLVVERITFAPQNPFPMDWLPAEQSPIDCADPYVENQNDPTTYDADCDLTAVLGLLGSLGTIVKDCAWITPSALLYGTVDGGAAALNQQWGPDNVVRPGDGREFMDCTSDVHVIGNYFFGCQSGDTDYEACIQHLGEHSVIEDNTFVGVGHAWCTEAGVDDGLEVVVATDCHDTSIDKRGPLVMLDSESMVLRGNRFWAVTGLNSAIVDVVGSDNVIEQNSWVGVTYANAIKLAAAAHRTQIRDNTFDFTPGFDSGYVSQRFLSSAIKVATTAGAPGTGGPYAVSVTGNRFRYEDELTDGSPEEAACPIGFTSALSALQPMSEWDISNNFLRGYYSLICDFGDNPDASGSWDEPFPVPYVGDWINTHSQLRLQWMGTADGNVPPACNAAARNQFYMFYNVAADSCAVGGGTKGTPCYCNGTAWTAMSTAAVLWP